MSDTDKLRRWADALRAAGTDLQGATAADVRDVVRARVMRDVAAGVSPIDRAAWPETQAGTRALQNATTGQRADVVGNVVSLYTTGHHFLHQVDRNGTAPAYAQLPDSLTPGDVAEVRERVASRLRGNLAR